MTKQLRRTVGNERKIAGVCGGIAKYFDLDPTLIRVAFVVLTIFYSAGLVAYIACAFIIPEDDGIIRGEYQVKHNCAPKDSDEMNSDGTGKNGWN